MKEIPLSRGYVAQVDDLDYARLAAHRWNADVRRQSDGKRAVYARRSEHRGPGLSPRPVYMHRVVAGAQAGQQVDHADGNGLNNTRANLRLCGMQSNARNQRKLGGTTSRFKGVYRSRGKWQAYIRIDGVQTYLGRYLDEEQAARAYDRGAREHFGEYARTNVDLGLLAAS